MTTLLKTVQAAAGAIRESLLAPDWKQVQQQMPGYISEVRQRLKQKVVTGEKLNPPPFPSSDNEYLVDVTESGLVTLILGHWLPWALLQGDLIIGPSGQKKHIQGIRAEIESELSALLKLPLNKMELEQVLGDAVAKAQSERTRIIKDLASWYGNGPSATSGGEYRVTRNREGQLDCGSPHLPLLTGLACCEAMLRSSKAILAAHNAQASDDNIEQKRLQMLVQLFGIDAMIEQLSPDDSFERMNDGTGRVNRSVRRWTRLLSGKANTFGEGQILSWRAIGSRYAKPVDLDGKALRTADGVRSFLLIAPTWEPGPHRPERVGGDGEPEEEE